MKGWSPFHKHEKDKDGNVIHHTYYPDKEPGDNYYESEEYKEKRKLKLVKDKKAEDKAIQDEKKLDDLMKRIEKRLGYKLVDGKKVPL